MKSTPPASGSPLRGLGSRSLGLLLDIRIVLIVLCVATKLVHAYVS